MLRHYVQGPTITLDQLPDHGATAVTMEDADWVNPAKLDAAPHSELARLRAEEPIFLAPPLRQLLVAEVVGHEPLEDLRVDATKHAVLLEYASKFQKAPTNIPPAVYQALGPKLGGALATALDAHKFEAF